MNSEAPGIAPPTSPDPQSPPARAIRHPCLSCGYELFGIRHDGKGRTCPECGKITTDDDLRRKRMVPPLGPAILIMCAPVYGGAIAVWLLDSYRATLTTSQLNGTIFILRNTLLAVLVLWAIVVPPIVATRRSAKSGRSPLGTFDETILGYVLNIGVPVLAVFVGLLVTVILKR